MCSSPWQRTPTVYTRSDARCMDIFGFGLGLSSLPRTLRHLALSWWISPRTPGSESEEEEELEEVSAFASSIAR